MKNLLLLPVFFAHLAILFSKIMSAALVVLVMAVLSSTTVHAFQYQSETEVDVIKIESVTDSLAGVFIKEEEVPGMNVAVAKNGKIIFLKSYGKADLELDSEVIPESVFGIASVTKQFTAAAIMKLIESGKLSLNDPITKHLPDYPTQGHNVTIRHLLNHTSGIKDYGIKHEKEPHWYKIPVTYNDMLELWAYEPFDFKPGEKYDYCNFNYYLLGEILKRQTGTAWIDYAVPELLKPLGLENIFFALPEDIIENRVSPYLHMDNKMIHRPYTDPSFSASGGGLSATIKDLVSWTQLLHAGKVVSAESLDQMTSPTTLMSGEKAGYGFGLYVNELYGHRKIYHGGTFGYGAYLSHYPESDITIAILANSSKGRARADQLERELAMIALDIKIKDIPLTPAELAAYEGTYTYQSTPTLVRELKIFAEKDRLMAQISDNRPFRLRYQGNDEFIPVINGITGINFKMTDGRVQDLTIHEGAWEITPAKRIK